MICVIDYDEVEGNVPHDPKATATNVLSWGSNPDYLCCPEPRWETKREWMWAVTSRDPKWNDFGERCW